MPYVRCGACGVTSFAPRSPLGPPSCPSCDAPQFDAFAGDSDPPSPWPRIDALLSLARAMLSVDATLLTEVADGRETALRTAGSWPVDLDGASAALQDTYCQAMLEGRIGNLVGDAASDPEVADLSTTRELGIGAWLGVPIEQSDTRLYILCCLAREARPDLTERDVRVLSGIAQSMSLALDVILS
jgi:GAF domain-containing protein